MYSMSVQRYSSTGNKNVQLVLRLFCSREGVLLGNLGGGVPPGTPNPAPISDPKMSFSTPVFRPGLKHYWPLAFRPEITQNTNIKSIPNSHVIFLSYLLGIETTETFKLSHSSLENHTRFQTNMQAKSSFSDRNDTNTIPFGAAHTYMDYGSYALLSSSFEWLP